MSLAELTLAVTIAGILTGLAAPAARSSLDAINTRAARETVLAAVARTRSAAFAQAGASLTLDAERRTATISSAAGHVVSQLDLAPFDVDILIDAPTPAITLTYDSRGIGRMASRTVRFRRGDAMAGLTISSYGRVRRW